nr:DUF177 domain-containing protein [bacterium]
MHVDVSLAVQNPGLEVAFRVEGEGLLEGLHPQQVGPVTGVQVEGVAKSPGERRLIVSGTLHAVIHLACANCADVFAQPVDAAFQEVFAPEAHPEEPDWFVYGGNRIDLEPLVAQWVTVSLPVAPVCREDCKGICPVCGVNRNQTACDCTQGESF